MKKYIVPGFAICVIVVGAFVIKGKASVSSNAKTCPNRPGCICSPNTTSEGTALKVEDQDKETGLHSSIGADLE